MWAVDVNTGEIKFPSTKKRHEAEEANLFGRAGKRRRYTGEMCLSLY
jgi:hypothetical protein